MTKIFLSISAVLLLLTAACKKGNPVEQQSFGFLTIELLGLPGTPSLEVYMESTKLRDSMKVGGTTKPELVVAGKKTKISFRKAGSNTVLADTSILMEGGQKLNLRLAYSEEFGIKGFLKEGLTLSPDSGCFQIYNRLAEHIMADSIQVDAVLYRVDPVTGDIVELAVCKDFQRFQLHPRSIVVPIKEHDIDVQYLFTLKNVKTDEFLMDDFGGPYISFLPEPGKKMVLIITDSRMDNGDGTFTYMFSHEKVVL